MDMTQKGGRELVDVLIKKVTDAGVGAKVSGTYIGFPFTGVVKLILHNGVLIDFDSPVTIFPHPAKGGNSAQREKCWLSFGGCDTRDLEAFKVT